MSFFASLRAAACLSFLGVAIFTLNLLQMATIVIRPFSMSLFRALNCRLAGTWWRLAVACYRAIGVEIVYSGDTVPRGENAIVFSNHQCMPDILVQLDFAIRAEMVENLKWMAKNVLRHVPGIGWGLSFLDTVFLRRTWADDAENIRATFARITDNHLPFWLMIFPEGTRLTAEKLKHSQKFAGDKGLPVFQRVMHPRTKGFIAAVRGLGAQAGAVYDLTLRFEGKAPKVWQFYRGECPRVHVHVTRFPIADLPKDDAALSSWLVHRFAAKDERLTGFVSTGRLSRE